MKKYIYVDTENVDFSSWYGVVPYLKSNDVLVLPYTCNSVKWSLDLMSKYGFPKCHVEFVPVQTGTKNALDFVLVAVLSQHVMRAKKSLHLVISRDGGYTPAITYLRHQGISRHNLVQVNSWASYVATHSGEFEKDCWKL